MAYTGNVTVGGAADTRELPGLTITKVAVGPMDNNAYLLRCRQTGELALIDAANEADTLLGLIGDTPLATIITSTSTGIITRRCGMYSRPPAQLRPPTLRMHQACRSRSPGRCTMAT